MQSKPLIDRIIEQSNKPLSVEEVIERRYAKEDLSEEALTRRISDVTKYLKRRTNHNLLIKCHRINGDEVWTDDKEKLKNDPEVEKAVIPLRELLRRYGRRKA